MLYSVLLYEKLSSGTLIEFNHEIITKSVTIFSIFAALLERNGSLQFIVVIWLELSSLERAVSLVVFLFTL